MWVDLRIGLNKNCRLDYLKYTFILCQYEELLERPKYSGFSGNGCKQSITQLINDTLSGQMKMPSKLF